MEWNRTTIVLMTRPHPPLEVHPLFQQKLQIHTETLVLALHDGLEPPTLCFSGIHSSHLS